MFLLTALMSMVAFGGPWKTSSTLMRLDEFKRPVTQLDEVDLFNLSGKQVPGFPDLKARFQVTFAEVDELPLGVKSKKDIITKLGDQSLKLEVLTNEGEAPRLLNVIQNPVPFRFFASEHFLYAYLPGKRFVPIAQLAVTSDNVPVSIKVSEPVVVWGTGEDVVISRSITIHENSVPQRSRTFDCVFDQKFGGLKVLSRDAMDKEVFHLADFPREAGSGANDVIVEALRREFASSNKSSLLDVPDQDLGAALEYAHYRFTTLSSGLTQGDLAFALALIAAGMSQYAALEGFPQLIEAPENQVLRLFSNPCGYAAGNVGVGPEYLRLARPTFPTL